ncbi:hypothetical protein [Mucilaginibacter mallensis]|nr:hypothetical protein [Mucilaginibacter mallensis]
MIRPRVKASTIIEVLISMIIIMVVFGIAMIIYANVTKSGLSELEIRAGALLNETLQNDEKDDAVSSRIFNVDILRIEQQVKSYDADGSLLEIDLVAYDVNGEKMAEAHKIIPNRND